MRESKGFTLIEVLAVMGVSLLLFGLVTQIFFHSQDAVGHSVDKVDSVQNARQLVDKLIPILAVACDSSELGGRPITLNLPDEPTEEMIEAFWIDVTTTEDLLADDFSEQKREFIPLQDLRAIHYRVEFLPEEGQLVLRQLSDDLSGVNPQVPAKLLASRLTGLRIRPLLNNDSLLEVTVRITPDTTIRPKGSMAPIETSASLPIPSESLR